MPNAPYPPQTLQADPLALYGRPDEPGAGPLTVLQSGPAAGDTIIRNAAGYWVNQPSEPDSTWPLAGLNQEANPSRPARTSFFGLPAFSALKDEAAALIKKEAIMVSIPVLPGDVISKIGVLVGATAAETPTHQWGALYEGSFVSSEAVLIGQSADAEAAAIGKEAPYAWALSKPVTITAAMAPHGFVYAAVQVTATVEPSLLGQTVVAAAQYAWATGGPSAFGEKFSVSGTEGVAKSPSGTLTKVTALPIVVLY